MSMRLINQNPALPPRPSYQEVANYANEKRDLEQSQEVVQDVQRQFNRFEKLEGGSWDSHPSKDAVVVNDVERDKSVSRWVSSLVFGVPPKGELIKEEQKTRFRSTNSEGRLFAYEAEGETRSFQLDYHKVIVHPDGQTEARLDHALLPTTLQPPKWKLFYCAQLPIQEEEEQGQDWDKIFARKNAREKRHHANELIARVLASAQSMSMLDDGPQDFRPDEPGTVIVCADPLQGELHRDADGRIKRFAQHSKATGPVGLEFEGGKEVYYDRGAMVVLDRQRGTLVYRSEVPEDLEPWRSDQPYPF